MRSIQVEKTIVPVITASMQSGETTMEEQLILQTKLLVGILMALNDMLAILSPKPPQRMLNVNTLPISA